MHIPHLILASASGARLRLLQNAGIEPIVAPSDFDESQIKISDPIELVQTLARNKAQTVANRLQTGLIIGCDSILVVDGEIHGKPIDHDDAIARWYRLRGKIGQLYTGHALIDLSKSQTLVKYQVTEVNFAPISDQEIAAYVHTGEPLNCAGCFALEGQGGLFIEKISGCHSNVIGLSLPLFRQMLQDLGYEVTDFWSKK